MPFKIIILFFSLSSFLVESIVSGNKKLRWQKAGSKTQNPSGGYQLNIWGNPVDNQIHNQHANIRVYSPPRRKTFRFCSRKSRWWKREFYQKIQDEDWCKQNIKLWYIYIEGFPKKILRFSIISVMIIKFMIIWIYNFSSGAAFRKWSSFFWKPSYYAISDQSHSLFHSRRFFYIYVYFISNFTNKSHRT